MSIIPLEIWKLPQTPSTHCELSYYLKRHIMHCELPKSSLPPRARISVREEFPPQDQLPVACSAGLRGAWPSAVDLQGVR